MQLVGAESKFDAWRPVTADRRVHLVWALLIWILGALPIASTLASPRYFDYVASQANLAVGGQDVGIAWAVGMLGTLALLGVAALGMAFALLSQGLWLPRGSLLLWVATLALAVGPLLAAMYGLYPGFALPLLVMPAVYTAVYLLPSPDITWLMQQVRATLLIYGYGSLFVAVVTTSWAVEVPYTLALIPAFSIRLHGIAPHANMLGSLMATYIVLRWGTSHRGWWSVIHTLVVVVVLILSQSKTTWVAIGIAHAVRGLFHIWAMRGLWRYATLAMLSSLILAGLLYIVTSAVWVETVDQAMYERQDIASLSGRRLVWEYTLDLWQRNPIFGYGPGLWDSRMRVDYLPQIGWIVPHAHNQFYQTLGESGIVGIAGLFVYAAALGTAAIKLGVLWQHTVPALATLLFVRSLTETPLRNIATDGNFYLHFVVFAVCVVGLKLAVMPNASAASSSGGNWDDEEKVNE